MIENNKRSLTQLIWDTQEIAAIYLLSSHMHEMDHIREKAQWEAWEEESWESWVRIMFYVTSMLHIVGLDSNGWRF